MLSQDAPYLKYGNAGTFLCSSILFTDLGWIGKILPHKLSVILLENFVYSSEDSRMTCSLVLLQITKEQVRQFRQSLYHKLNTKQQDKQQLVTKACNSNIVLDRVELIVRNNSRAPAWRRLSQSNNLNVLLLSHDAVTSGE